MLRPRSKTDCSGETVQALGQSGHNFSRKTFHRPTYCQHCTELLWGLTNQGIICEICNFVSHERCLNNVITPCLTLAHFLVKVPVAHSWSGPSFFRKKFCNVCRRRLEDNTAIRCQICEYYVHEECQIDCVSNCKQCATYVPYYKQTPDQQLHHWREGNVFPSAKCFQCKKSCGSSECMTGMRCEWCGLTAHAACYLSIPNFCSFGYLHKLVLPPYAVSLPNLALWATKPHSSEGMTNEEKSFIPDERLSLHTNGDLSESGHSSVRIYDGDINSPKMYRDVEVPRTAQVLEVLEEALKKFSIDDDPSDYYLSRVVGKDSERTLESHEIPVQFHEPGDKPLIFLRTKNAERKSGAIRVYSGILNIKHEYTSLNVTAGTTVNDTIRSALIRFGLKDKNPEDFSLIEVRMNEGVTERRMENFECPWKVLTDIKKRSIKEMKLTRFYLRQTLEPLGSVCMCVGNLPASMVMPEETYKSIIREVLGDCLCSNMCTVEALYPLYGMAFLRFPSADFASEAKNRLKECIVDEKNLFVILLPNIQPQMLSDQHCPLLVFVNPKSGGGQGLDMLSAFRRLLNPHQVYSLLDGGPLPGLYAFRNIPEFRILVCGGDGTVGWLLSCLDDMQREAGRLDPPVGILPLGTGNDLARVLGWGAGYSGGEEPLSLLMEVERAIPTKFDRWHVIFDIDATAIEMNDIWSLEVKDPAETEVMEETTNTFVMNNYFGVGIDADLCLDFHLAREESPEKFNSRLHNKGVYLRAGVKKMVRNTGKEINDDISLEVDGNSIELPVVQGIVVLNISSWGAGANPWGMDREEDYSRPAFNDGMVEVVGLTGVMHLGQIQSGIRNAVRLAQGSQVNIKLKSELPVQIDGEPWLQAPGQVVIRPTVSQASMLIKQKAKLKLKPSNTVAQAPQAMRPRLRTAQSSGPTTVWHVDSSNGSTT